MRKQMKLQLQIFLIAILFLISIVSCRAFYFNDTTIIATIDKKESISTRKSHTYLIFTNMGVFENDDVFIRGKFNSSDFYNNLKEGKTYELTVVGMRIPFLSMYQNIIHYKLIK